MSIKFVGGPIVKLKEIYNELYKEYKYIDEFDEVIINKITSRIYKKVKTINYGCRISDLSKNYMHTNVLILLIEMTWNVKKTNTGSSGNLLRQKLYFGNHQKTKIE